MELVNDLPDRVVEETFRSESDEQYLASPDTTMATCPAASPFAINSQENSESDLNDKVKTKDTLTVADQFSCAGIQDVFKSQKLSSALPKTNETTYCVPKDDTGVLNTDRNPLSSGLRTLSGNNTLMSDSLPALSKSLEARQETTEPFQEDKASTQDSKLSLRGTDNIKESNSAHCVTALLRSSATKPDNFRLSTSKIVSQHLAAQSETFKSVPDDQEKEKSCEDISVRPDKVFTTGLDMETPEFQLQDNVGARIPDVLKCSQVCQVQLTRIPEKISAVSTTLSSLELDETDLKILYTKSCFLNESQVANSLPGNPLALVPTKLKEKRSASAKIMCKGKSESDALKHNEVLSSSKSCGTVAEYQLTGALAEETTLPHVKPEETSDFRHAEEQTRSSALCTVEVDALSAAEIPAGDNKQLTVADTAQSAGTGQLEMAEGENTGERRDPDGPESKPSTAPRRRVKATLPFEKSPWEVPASLEETEVNKRQVDVKNNNNRLSSHLLCINLFLKNFASLSFSAVVPCILFGL